MADKEGKFPVGVPTRGEGMPGNRGGNVVPFQPKEGPNPLAAQNAAKEKAERDWLLGKPNRKELEEQLTQIVGGIVAVRNQSHGIGLRVESLVLALRRWTRALMLTIAGGGNVSPNFDDMLADSHTRMSKWLNMIQMFEQETTPLAQIRDEVVKWNEDPDNPRFQFSGFSPGTLDKKLVEELDMNREDKLAFMDVLGTPETIKDKILELIAQRLTPQGIDKPEEIV